MSEQIPLVELPEDLRTLAHGIKVGRYTSKDFLQWEFDKLWSRVWQVACRVDAIPEVNDYTVYDIGERSLVIVRRGDGQVNAYHNFCPHRGTTLARGQGTFDKGNIICPFHGWRWNTAGENTFVLAREEFKQGKLESCDVALRSVHCLEYQGMVFVNFAKDPEPFEDFIAPLKDLMEGMLVGEMRDYWWKKIDINGNWKVAQEAFFEGYHVPATHPQLEIPAASQIYEADQPDDSAFSHHSIAYEVYRGGHGRFYAGKPTVMQGAVKSQVHSDPVENMAARLQLLVDGMDAQVLQEDVNVLRSVKKAGIPEGSSVGAEYIKALYADAANRGRPMPEAKPELLNMWGGEVYLFPNILMLFHGGNMMMYRALPHASDPDKCTFEIFSTRTQPDYMPKTRAEVIEVDDPGDPKVVYKIPRQDLANIERMQKGMKTGAMKQTWLASYNEQLILNMHQHLDQYLTGDH